MTTTSDTPVVTAALTEASLAGRSSIEPEAEIARPGGKLWRRNPGRRSNNNQRPRAVCFRHGPDPRVVVIMTQLPELGLYLATLAWPEADWSTAVPEPGWWRRNPALPGDAWNLQPTHGDAGGSFPGLLLRPATVSAAPA